MSNGVCLHCRLCNEYEHTTRHCADNAENMLCGETAMSPVSSNSSAFSFSASKTRNNRCRAMNYTMSSGGTATRLTSGAHARRSRRSFAPASNKQLKSSATLTFHIKAICWHCDRLPTWRKGTTRYLQPSRMWVHCSTWILIWRNMKVKFGGGKYVDFTFIHFLPCQVFILHDTCRKALCTEDTSSSTTCCMLPAWSFAPNLRTYLLVAH